LRVSARPERAETLKFGLVARPIWSAATSPTAHHREEATVSHLPAAALLILQRQQALITADQLTSVGVSPHSRRRLLDERVLEHRGHSVYRVVGCRPTLDSRAIELCLQHPRGFITGPTGGTILGLRRMPFASQLVFCVPHGQRFDHENHVKLRQSNYIPDHHVRTLDNGIRIASHERLAFDLSGDLRTVDLSSVIEQMIQRGDASPESLTAVARELCTRGRRGSVPFLSVLLRRTWGPAAESHPELKVLEALRSRGVPVEPQTSLTLPNGKPIRIDMAVADIRWAVEVDIHPDHAMTDGITKDKRRDRQLHLFDWQVERVTALDLLDLDATISELVALYHTRCATRGNRT
jgi:hypothetical protein